jgi:CheY-like chemotaxis protein
MKLLVVEDEALLRHHLRTRLTEAGHVVESVANAEEALYQVGQFNHDLAVIDLGLPGLGGLDLIRQLRTLGKAFPILILLAVTGRTRSKGSPRALTTMWSSRSSSRSSKPASMHCCGVPAVSYSRRSPPGLCKWTSIANRPS